MKNKYSSLLLLVICLLTATTAFSQPDAASKGDRKDKRVANGIGGKEHNAEILGVKIGMDVPTALEAVFINANRRAGQEKPDSKRAEGKDKKIFASSIRICRRANCKSFSPMGNTSKKLC